MSETATIALLQLGSRGFDLADMADSRMFRKQMLGINLPGLAWNILETSSERLTSLSKHQRFAKCHTTYEIKRHLYACISEWA